MVRGLDAVDGGLVLVPRNNSISFRLAMSLILLGFEREGSLIRNWLGRELTPSRLRLSSRCRGTTVTISISHRKATSIGVSPGARGNAIFRLKCFLS